MSEPFDARLRALGPSIEGMVAEAAGRRAGTPHEALTRTLTRTLQEYLIAGPVAGPVTVLEARALGSAFAAAGVDLAVMIGELQLAAVTLSHVWWRAAGPEHVDDLFALSRSWVADLTRLRAELNTGWCAEIAAAGHRSDARGHLVVELLCGRAPSPRLRATAQVTLADHYAVLVCSPRALLASGRGWDAELADQLGTRDALALARDDRLVVLVPAPPVPAAGQDRAVRELFSAVSHRLGVSLAAVTFTGVRGLPTAVAHALHGFETGLDEGATGVLLIRVESEEVGLPAPVAPRDLLTEPLLVATLHELYHRDLDKRRTAEALGISRRALTRRLHRVAMVSGVDPVSPAGRRYLLTLLAAAPQPAYSA